MKHISNGHAARRRERLDGCLPSVLYTHLDNIPVLRIYQQASYVSPENLRNNVTIRSRCD